MKPIFVVGAGRSGTTLLYHIIAGHPDLAWISNYTDYFRLPFLAFLSRFYFPKVIDFFPRPFDKIFPQPFEGLRILRSFMKYFKGGQFSESLSEEYSSDAKKIFYQHIKFQGKKRFLNKNTAFPTILCDIDKIFPDARYIHIIRDPRAVVASTLLVHWWSRVIVNHDGEVVYSSEFEEKGIDPVEVAAKRWANSVSAILKIKKKLGNRYKEICYEDLVGDTSKVLEDILKHCDLTWNSSYERHISQFNLSDQNYKYRTQLNRKDLVIIEAICKPLLEKTQACYYD